MITIKTLKGAAQGVAGYLCEEQKLLEGYYSAEGKSAASGVYIGGDSLGLNGRAVGAEFSAILSGKNPADGHDLYKGASGSKRRLGFDMTLSPDKSVSVLWARLDGEGRSRLEGAFDRAVRETLSHGEKYALCDAVRRGKGGLKRERPAELAWAIFKHGSSRENDPQLHAHCVLLNVARREDGTYGAIQEQGLYRAQMEMRAVFDGALADQLKKEFGLDLSLHKDGIRVDGIPKDVLRHFSKRREAIERAAEALSTTTKRMGAELNLATRPAKTIERAADLFSAWQADMSARGFLEKSAQELFCKAAPSKDISADQKERRLDEAMQAAATEKTILSKSQVRGYVARAFCGEVAPRDLDPLFERAIVSGRFVALKNDKGAEVFSSRPVIEREQGVIALGRSMARDGQKAIDRSLIDPVLARYRESGAKPMSFEQAEAASHLLSGGRLSVLVGAAGTGKSYSLEAVREIYESAGYRVMGAAPTGRAAEALSKSAAIDSSTIDRLLLDLGSGKVKLDEKCAIIVDEAGMVGTKKMAALLQSADRAGARVALVGDDRQLAPIDQGRAFSHLKSEIGSFEISEVRRQREIWQRDASGEFRAGRPLDALQRYQAAGYVHHFQTWDSLKMKMMGDWFRDRAAHPEKTQLVIASRNEEVRELNEMARSALIKSGEISTKRQITCETTSAGAEALGRRSFSEGDRIYFLKNDKNLGVLNGSLGTIEAIRGAQKSADLFITVKLDSGAKVSFSPERYSHIDHGYAATVHKSQGETADLVYAVPSDMTSREVSYVMATRHRDECRFYIATEKVTPFTERHAVELETEGRIKLNLERTAQIMGRSEEDAISQAFKEKISSMQKSHETREARPPKELVAAEHQKAAEGLSSKDRPSQIEAVYQIASLPRATELRYDPVVLALCDYQKEAQRMLSQGDFSAKALAGLEKMISSKETGTLPALTDSERAAHYDRMNPYVIYREGAINEYRGRQNEKALSYVSPRQKEILRDLEKCSEPVKAQDQLKNLALSKDAVGPLYGEAAQRGWLQKEAFEKLKNFSASSAKDFAKRVLARDGIGTGKEADTAFSPKYEKEVNDLSKGARDREINKRYGRGYSLDYSRGKGRGIDF